MSKKVEGFEYICTIKTILNYMQNEIDSAVNNNEPGFVTEFYIILKNNEKYNVYIMKNDLKESKNEIDIVYNKEHYKSLEQFMNNAKIEDTIIKDVKGNLKVLLPDFSSSYLEEHRVKEIIHKKTFKADKGVCNLYLFCSCIMATLSIFLFIVNKDMGFLILLIFPIILGFLPYMYYKTRKIVYLDKEKSFTVNGFSGKKVYLIKDIKHAIKWRVGTKGITIYFNKNKKLNINFAYSNSEYVSRILEQNNISILEK